ncbi:MAG: hypothetical protein MUP47_09605 [Phycisphaerae bacterium]|nr:hypothetical protein [Phycisphaerae bacterium]
MTDPASGEKFYLDSQFGTGFRGTKVVKRDEATGRPTSVRGENPEQLRRILKQALGDSASIELSVVPAAPVVGMNTKPRPFFMPETEVGAIKSLLLTYDHLLRDSERPFTRSEALRPVREFVRSSVMDGRALDWASLKRFSLGLQYQLLPQIAKHRCSVEAPRTEFEHVMMVSGDPARKTLDAVWLIADTDPWGFRLADDWCGAYFTCLFVNGILRGTTASKPRWLDFPCVECKPTMMRSLPPALPHNEALVWKACADDVYTHVNVTRIEAYRRAVWYVEMHCDETVAQELAKIARANSEGDRSALCAVKERLARFYALRIKDDSDRRRFEDVVEGGIRKITDSLACQSMDGCGENEVNWGKWVPIHRGLLSDLV